MLLTHRLPLPAKVPCQQIPAVFVAKPRRHKPVSNNLVSCAAPRVAIEFNTAEGPVKLECDSGDILRDVMLDQKVDLYTTWGKVWQCGGSGQCGTCVVKASTEPMYHGFQHTADKFLPQPLQLGQTCHIHRCLVMILSCQRKTILS